MIPHKTTQKALFKLFGTKFLQSVSTCNTTVFSPPQQKKSKTCMSTILNRGCDGPDTETQNRSVNIPCNGEAFKLVKHLVTITNAFIPNALFFYLLKTYDVFRGQGKGALRTNGLMPKESCDFIPPALHIHTC